MIESPQNDTYKQLLSLTSSKGLKEQGLFLLSGEKLIREFLQNPHLDIIHEVLLPNADLITSINPVILAAPLFAQLDVLGTHFNMLVVRQPDIAVITADDIQSYEPKSIELVAPIGDPGNLGALIRSCEAFGIKRVILTGEAAHPFLPKAVKASAGSVLRVSLVRGPALVSFPQSCIALDMEGTPLDDFTWPQQGLLLVGEEGPGLSAKHFTTRIYIPTLGVESLNVVVAASIALSRLPKRG